MVDDQCCLSPSGKPSATAHCISVVSISWLRHFTAQGAAIRRGLPPAVLVG